MKNHYKRMVNDDDPPETNVICVDQLIKSDTDIIKELYKIVININNQDDTDYIESWKKFKQLLIKHNLNAKNYNNRWTTKTKRSLSAAASATGSVAAAAVAPVARKVSDEVFKRSFSSVGSVLAMAANHGGKSTRYKHGKPRTKSKRRLTKKRVERNNNK